MNGLFAPNVNFVWFYRQYNTPLLSKSKELTFSVVGLGEEVDGESGGEWGRAVGMCLGRV